MASISTNIYKNLIDEDKTALEARGRKLKEVRIYEYKEAGIELVPKFVFDGFDIIAFLRDNLLWEALVLLATTAFGIAKKRSVGPDIHFWITDLSAPYPINVAFGASNQKAVREAFSSLKLFLPKTLQEYKPKKGQIVWLSYNPKTSKWKVQVF